MTAEPDRFEKGVRFGCGAFLGLLLGFFSALQFAPDGFLVPALVALVVATAIGFLAMRYGDEFWRTFSHWLRAWF